MIITKEKYLQNIPVQMKLGMSLLSNEEREQMVADFSLAAAQKQQLDRAAKVQFGMESLDDKGYRMVTGTKGGSNRTNPGFPPLWQTQAQQAHASA